MFYNARDAHILKEGAGQCQVYIRRGVVSQTWPKCTQRACDLLSSVSLQRLIQYELIFRLLLKVTVDWPRECNSIQFMRGALLSREVRSSIISHILENLTGLD